MQAAVGQPKSIWRCGPRGGLQRLSKKKNGRGGKWYYVSREKLGRHAKLQSWKMTKTYCKQYCKAHGDRCVPRKPRRKRKATKPKPIGSGNWPQDIIDSVDDKICMC